MGKSRLEATIREKNKTIDAANHFNSYARQKKREMAIRARNRGLAALGVLLLLGLFIYLPQFFMKDGEEDTYVSKDMNAVGTYTQLLKDSPDGDWDGDGILNSVESRQSMDVWSMDTDGDGVTDAQEVAAGTNPAIADNDKVAIMSSWLASNGIDYKEPYKVNGVILWAKNTRSRANGTVVRTINGYQFNGFRGYAQFPEGSVAYSYVDGVHKKLKYRKDEDAWAIKGDYEVFVYDEPLEMTNRLGLFGLTAYLPDFFRGLSAVLPDKGFITCTRMALVDTEPDARKNTMVQSTSLQSFSFEMKNTRLGKNDNALEDLATAMRFIDEGKPLAVSLIDDEGEAVFIITGYTQDCNLMVADASTKQYVGTIRINVDADNLYNGEGFIQDERYEFAGMGFDSTNGARISYLADVFYD